MKIFLTGVTGQVGFELQRSLSLWGEVLAPTRHELDLSDMSAVSHWLEIHAPECIINAAAYTAVDKAETDLQAALCINQDLPCVLAQYAARHAIRLFHYSTDYVYDGSGQDFRSEEAPTGPLNAYGRSKLAGDQAIMDSGASYIIFRTSWIYAARGNNFLKTMLRLAEQRDHLSIVADQIGAPTSARLLADVTNIALARRDVPPVSTMQSVVARRAGTVSPARSLRRLAVWGMSCAFRMTLYRPSRLRPMVPLLRDL